MLKTLVLMTTLSILAGVVNLRRARFLMCMENGEFGRFCGIKDHCGSGQSTLAMKVILNKDI